MVILRLVTFIAALLLFIRLYSTALICKLSRKRSSCLFSNTISENNGLISPSLSNNIFKDRSDKFCKVIDHNWEYGFCEHRTVFEGVDDISHIRFRGDLLAFGVSTGKCCIIRISTGEVLDKYYQHSGMVSALDFDGYNCISGGADGITNIYQVTLNNPLRFGNCKHRFTVHTKAITAIRLARKSSWKSNHKDPVSDVSDIAVSCGSDLRIIALNITR